MNRPRTITEAVVQRFLSKKFEDREDLEKYYDDAIERCTRKYGRTDISVKEWQYVKWRALQQLDGKERVQFT